MPPNPESPSDELYIQAIELAKIREAAQTRVGWKISEAIAHTGLPLYGLEKLTTDEFVPEPIKARARGIVAQAQQELR